MDSQAFRVDRYAPFLEEAARLANLAPDGQIVDIGCGPTCCAQAIRTGRKWYVDPLLQEYGRMSDLPAGHHIAACVEEADLPEEFFDLAICLNVLDHVRDPWKALAVARQAVKPEGVFLCAVYTRGPIMAFLRNLQELAGLSTDVAHPYSFTTASVSAALRRVGFLFEPPRVVDASRERAEMIWCCRKPGPPSTPTGTAIP
jgi:SAM-dependent methyltransferase